MSLPCLHRFSGLRGDFRFAMAVLTLAGGYCSSGSGEENTGNPSAAGGLFPGGPEPVTAANFEALITNSPFLRSLDLTDTFILTGIAHIEGDLFVTLFQPGTRETRIVSGAANPQGMRLVGVTGDQSDLESVTARISMASGEVFSVRFDERQLKPGEGKPSTGSGGGGSDRSSSSGPPQRDYREGISGDGFRGAPPPELVKKLSKLNSDTRDRLIREIGELRDKGVSSEERQVIFNRMVDRALEGRR
jgi:hypothetical protein